MIDNKLVSSYASQKIVELITLPFFKIFSFVEKRKGEGSDILILLTSCIQPVLSQKYSVVNDESIRLNQYLDAIRFYLSETSASILFVDNSGYDISDYPEVKKWAANGRIEVLYYNDENVRKRGKGYGEQHIIKFASENSHFWEKSKFIFKITGRLKILNIGYWVYKAHKMSNSGNPLVIAQRKRKCEWLYSMCFLCNSKFLDKKFFQHMENVNEGDREYSFEKALYDYAINTNGVSYTTPFFPFMIRGILGATGKPYKSHTFVDVLRCMVQKL